MIPINLYSAKKFKTHYLGIVPAEETKENTAQIMNITLVAFFVMSIVIHYWGDFKGRQQEDVENLCCFSLPASNAQGCVTSWKFQRQLRLTKTI